MATVTKTYTENDNTSYKSTWTVTFSLSDQTIAPTGSSNPAFLIPTVKVKRVNADKNKGACVIYLTVIAGNIKYRVGYQESSSSIVSGTTYTLKQFYLASSNANAYATNGKIAIYDSKISTVFGSTVSSQNFAVYLESIDLESWYGSSYSNRWNRYFNEWSGNGTLLSSALAKLALKAPPTFNAGVLSSNTSGYWDNNITTVSGTISGATGKYGATITKSTLTIGSQVATGTGNGTLSINLNRAGIFTPELKITDSRGQTAVGTLDPITVQQYIKPSAEFGVYRCNSSGARADEGSYGLITATIDYTSAIATLQAPTVKINGTTTSNVTWYSDSGLTSQITNWANVASGATVYGLINGSFSTTSSYIITLIAQDQYSQSDVITQTISTAFYTIDVQAGGKEIAFGAPANDNVSSYDNGVMKCSMELCLTLDTNAQSGTDANIYSALQSLGWTDVIM